MWRSRLSLSIGFLIFVFAACNTELGTELHIITDQPHHDERIAQGIRVYRANYCGSCHTLTIANTHGTFGPNHDRAGLDAAQHLELLHYAGSAGTVSEYLLESIIAPSTFYTPGYETTNHHMPAFTHLSEDDIEALIYMLHHQQ